MTSAEHIRQLTGLRALAAWWVVLYHFREALQLTPSSWVARFSAAGDLAVDLFFVLSGFVLAINNADRFSKWSALEHLRFAWQRLSRIYPLHFFLLLACAVNVVLILTLSRAANLGDRYEVSYLLMSLLLVQNWGFSHELGWNIPAWSISTEWAAYLLFPLVLIAVRACARSLMSLTVLGVIFCGLLAFAYESREAESLGEQITQLGLLRCILGFALGVTLGAVHRWYRVQLQSWAGLAGVICVILVLAGTGLDAPDYWFVPAASGLLVVFLSVHEGLLTKILSQPLLVYLGEISYATYICHFVIKDWVKFAVPALTPVAFGAYALLVLLVSIFLHHWVEKPSQRRMLGLLTQRLK